jgi:hypothetical protein
VLRFEWMKIDEIILVIKEWSIVYGVTIHDVMMMECWNIGILNIAR